MDIDVVCLNTEEFGRRPLADSRFADNMEACNAVRRVGMPSSSFL